MVNPNFSMVYESIGSKEIPGFLIIISRPCYLWAVGPAIVIFSSTNKKTSETRWEVANKFDNLVIWIFYSALRINLCINTVISFVLRDSTFHLIGLLEVGATVDIRFSGVAGVLCMCE